MTKEVWVFYKEIKRSNKYFKKGDILTVSDWGRVKCNGEFYKCTIGTDGYYYLCNRSLHRIIAELFISNPYNLPCVDHIDGNRLNNMVSNLRWCTYKTNNNNPITKQRQRESVLIKPVLQYTLDNKFVAEYISGNEARRQTKIIHITECCQHKYKSAGGYIWKYKNI